ncbi:MAG: DUF1844 domain-containing protein [Candidatus Omnitrophota bacterium]
MEFKELIGIFELSGWQALGKIPNPLTGKTEVNLDAARNTIDILLILREKSKNNLTPEEERQLAGTIANLQINYTNEVEKTKSDAGKEKEKTPEPTP